MGYFMGHRTCRIEPEHGVYGISPWMAISMEKWSSTIGFWVPILRQTHMCGWLGFLVVEMDHWASFCLPWTGAIGEIPWYPENVQFDEEKIWELWKTWDLLVPPIFRPTHLRYRNAMAPAPPSQSQESSGNVLIARDGSWLGWIAIAMGRDWFWSWHLGVRLTRRRCFYHPWLGVFTFSMLQVRVACGRHNSDNPAAAFPVVLSQLGIPLDFGKVWCLAAVQLDVSDVHSSWFVVFIAMVFHPFTSGPNLSSYFQMGRPGPCRLQTIIHIHDHP
jgi:hypothetical protein